MKNPSFYAGLVVSILFAIGFSMSLSGHKDHHGEEGHGHESHETHSGEEVHGEEDHGGGH